MFTRHRAGADARPSGGNELPLCPAIVKATDARLLMAMAAKRRSPIAESGQFDDAYYRTIQVSFPASRLCRSPIPLRAIAVSICALIADS